MQTTTAPLPAFLPPPRRRAPRRTSPARTVAKLLTLLVGIATAAVTLGPRAWVVVGRSTADGWLLEHPTPARLVAALGGVEPAGNLVLFMPFAALLAVSVSLRHLPVAFAVLVCLPIGVEWTQRYLPGRVPDGGDVVRNTTGLLVAFGVVAVLRAVACSIGRVRRLAI